MAMRPFHAGPDGTSEFMLESPGSVRATLGQMNATASSVRVNRTRRVVREQATNRKARRSRVRSLWAPLMISSALLMAVCFAVWSVLSQYETTPNGTPGASNQMMILMLWSLPVSIGLLAVVWFRQSRSQGDGGRGE